MEPSIERIVVAAPNKAGEAFVGELLRARIPFAVIVNNRVELNKVRELGATECIELDTVDQTTWLLPEFPVGRVFLFETSQTLTCRYIQICRAWTVHPIYVITHSVHPRLIYKSLGAAYVLHTNTNDVSFLMESIWEK